MFVNFGFLLQDGTGYAFSENRKKLQGDYNVAIIFFVRPNVTVGIAQEKFWCVCLSSLACNNFLQYLSRMEMKVKKSVVKEIWEISLRSRVKQKIFMKLRRNTNWDESLTQNRSSPPFFMTQYSEETEEKIWIISSVRFFMIKGSDMKKIENYSGMVSGKHELWLFIRQTNLNLSFSFPAMTSCNIQRNQKADYFGESLLNTFWESSWRSGLLCKLKFKVLTDQLLV